jgi:5'-deoxynucleotidase YfbR-like HD superfamily hydrolase
MENIEEIETFDLESVSKQQKKQKQKEKEKAKEKLKKELIEEFGSEEKLNEYFEYKLRTSL